MAILIRGIIVIVGLALAAFGAWLAATGYVYKDISNAPLRANVPHSAKVIGHARTIIRQIPKEYREELNLGIGDSDMFYPLAAVGGLIFFIGLIAALNGAFRRKQPEWAKGEVEKEADDGRIADNLIPVQPKKPAEAPAAAGNVISIDEGGMDIEEDEAEKLRDVGHLVTISQALLEPATVKLVFQTFRPDMEQYFSLFNEDGAERFAHQILNSIILRHRRHSKEITADQFQTQDVRIIECERETICHRYMPPKEKMVSDAIREKAGKVYDSFTRSKIQKEVSGEADDWRDVSLRNATEVLAVKTALDTAAA